MLSSEVINELDRKITMDDLDPTVIADLNDSLADGSIGPGKLSSEVSNVLKPAILSQPNSMVEVAGTSTYLTVDATGGNNFYQWKKDGLDIVGATSPTLSITDLNASVHEGNYSVVVSNAFGSASSSVAQIDVNGSLTEGLVGWWKFDETEGTVASDSSGNGNDGNLTNGPNWTAGKIGGALSFDGVDDYVDLGYSNIFHDVSECTVSIWLSVLSESSTWREIITLEGVQAIGIKNTGQFHLNTGNGSSWDGGLNTNLTLELSHWYSLTISRDSNGAKLFIDGNLDVFSNLHRSTGTANHRVLIGAKKQSGGVVNYTKGYFDDLRIYDRALTAFEIKSLHELGEQPVQESGSGTATLVNGTVVDGSITTNQLSEQILKYLKPEITQQPTAGSIYADTNHTISVTAEGKYLTYQWKKNGVNLAGETNATLKITDANATQHEGNYSVVVSNDFGSVESEEFELVLTFGPNSNLTPLLWLDASKHSAFNLSNDNVSEWRDLSTSNSHGTQSNPTYQPKYSNNSLDGKAVVTFDGVDDYIAHNTLGNTETATLFFLFRLHSISEFSSIISTDGPWQGTSGETHIIFQGTSSNYGINWATKVGSNYADTTKTSNSYNSPNTWHLVSAVIDKANFSFYSNGSDFGSGEKVDFNNNFTNFRIGSWYDLSTNDRFFDGDIAEMILYGSALDDINRQSVEGYLAHKWNLATELPSGHLYKNSAP
jgi:hypothetical protein